MIKKSLPELHFLIVPLLYEFSQKHQQQSIKKITIFNAKFSPIAQFGAKKVLI
jgi:hypothetical protein